MKVKDNYSAEEFEALIDLAEDRASNDWEMQFVADMKVRFKEYGVESYLTSRQADKLESIANR